MTSSAASPVKKVEIAVVIPVYRAEGVLNELCRRLDAVLTPLGEYRIVLVDDRSPDSSWSVIKSLAAANPRIIGIRLSRNFGQHYAITAGLRATSAEWTIVMDCDLEDPPEAIPELIACGKNGNDIVLALRKRRTHNPLKIAASRLFYRLFILLSGIHLDSRVGTFRALRFPVVQAFNRMEETFRLFGAMVGWLGFSVGYVDVVHGTRFDGKSNYNLHKLFRLALDGMISFSNRPLYLAVILGSVMSLLSLTYVVYLLLRYLIMGPIPIIGWLSTVIVTAFIGGMVLLNLGIIGLYIGRIYDQTKGRPLFVIDEIVGAARKDDSASILN